MIVGIEALFSCFLNLHMNGNSEIDLKFMKACQKGHLLQRLSANDLDVWRGCLFDREFSLSGL